MIDVAIKSASRPEYLQIVLRSLQKYLNTEGIEKVNWILHEDYIDSFASEACIHVTQKFDLFKKILITNPYEGNPKAIESLVELAKGKYLFHWEDDWELLRWINLRDVINLMENNSDVNMIAFRRGVNKPYSAASQETVRKEGKLVKCYDWVLFPAVWRASFIRKAFYYFDVMEENADDIGKMLRKFHSLKELGTYFWGGFGEGNFVKHIGEISTRVLQENRNG